ncbi:hypothetical protein H0264_35790 [Nocardia huaxiensis]|uniref:Uncharacterized protein n=2 Tax=Nocardia huaxiensis TaxID=2755382 RepID=A0A7D6ZH78_9NOCA|nr:hypothetical protein H0264_35790 [Nocardia huaxiensis]
MSSLASALRSEHNLSTTEADMELGVDKETLPMAGTTYYYNKDPQDKKHKHLATAM